VAVNDALAAIAERHGLRAEQVVPIPAGVANHVYLLGDDLVLRIPRDEEFARDLRKEALVIPAARRAGVRTPAVVSYDNTHELMDVPYMICERAHGTELDRLELPPARTPRAMRRLGADLARLHRVGRGDLRAPEVPTDVGGWDPRERISEMARQGWLDAEAARWLSGWFDRLAKYRPDETGTPLALLHGDVAPQNILVDAARLEYRALLDWGDAAWADPAMEFAKLPLFELTDLLAGYRSELPDPGQDGEWEARALWYHLDWGLGGLTIREPRPGERHWTAPPPSRLLGVMRFFTGNVPEPWRRLT
jgi:hygromycin-B 7''-O-kinase